MVQDRHKAHFGQKRRLSKTLPKQVGPPGLAHQLERVRAAACSQRLNHGVHIHQEQHALGSKRELLLLRHMVHRINAASATERRRFNPGFDPRCTIAGERPGLPTGVTAIGLGLLHEISPCPQRKCSAYIPHAEEMHENDLYS